MTKGSIKRVITRIIPAHNAAGTERLEQLTVTCIIWPACYDEPTEVIIRRMTDATGDDADWRVSPAVEDALAADLAAEYDREQDADIIDVEYRRIA